MKFIEGIKVMIVRNAPLAEEETRAAIAQWENGEEPSTPNARAIHAMCEAIKSDMDGGAS